jgi:hypothetical protein
MIEWIKIDKETATATYDSVLKAFNDDGGLPEDGLRLLIDEAKKQTKVSRDSCSRRYRRSFDAQRRAEFTLIAESPIWPQSIQVTALSRPCERPGIWRVDDHYVRQIKMSLQDTASPGKG